MLDGAPCPDARARRAPHEGRARLELGNQLLGTPQTDVGSVARPADRAAVGWWGAASGGSPERLGARRPADLRYKKN